MLQRNDTGYPQHVMAYPTDEDPDREPFVVGADEIKDFPTLLGGFSAVEEQPKPAAKKTASAPAAATAEDVTP